MSKRFSRRGFLRLLGITAAVTVAAPVIETAKLFTPPPGGWHAPPGIHFDAQFFTEQFMAPPLSMRYVKQFDAQRMANPTRLDVLYGMAVVQPDSIVRVTE